MSRFVRIDDARTDERTKYFKDLLPNWYEDEKRQLQGFIPQDRERLIPDLSLCHFEEGKCTTCILFCYSELPNTIELSFLMSEPGRADHLAGVLNEALRRLRDSYRKCNLVFSVVNKESELIARRFISGDMKVMRILMSRRRLRKQMSPYLRRWPENDTEMTIRM